MDSGLWETAFSCAHSGPECSIATDGGMLARGWVAIVTEEVRALRLPWIVGHESGRRHFGRICLKFRARSRYHRSTGRRVKKNQGTLYASEMRFFSFECRVMYFIELDCQNRTTGLVGVQMDEEMRQGSWGGWNFPGRLAPVSSLRVDGTRRGVRIPRRRER